MNLIHINNFLKNHCILSMLCYICDMKMNLKPQSRIRTKGFDISIGSRIDQIAIISHSSDEFTPFTSIKKGGRLAKIKRIFKRKLSCSSHFFFEGFSEQDTLRLIKILK